MKQLMMPLSLLPGLGASDAFGWGNAAHTYFSRQLGSTDGHLNCNEMYGSVLTDAFNLMLDEKGAIMSDQLHSNFTPFVHSARTCGQTAAAFGVASHNFGGPGGIQRSRTESYGTGAHQSL